jgi:hypothetical protein
MATETMENLIKRILQRDERVQEESRLASQRATKLNIKSVVKAERTRKDEAGECSLDSTELPKYLQKEQLNLNIARISFPRLPQASFHTDHLQGALRKRLP